MNRKTPKGNRGAEFLSNKDGNAIMIFGLSLLPVMLMLGATLDYTRFTMMRAALQQAVDSAALMVASKMTSATTNANAKLQSQVILNSMPRMAYASVTSTTLSDDKQTFCINAEINVANTFMQLAHITSLTPKVTSCANLAGGVDPNTTYEIALVLDNSGSMSSSAGGKSKMQALRDAAKSFVDTMYSKSTNVKMSVTPFAAAVRAVDPDIAANRTASWVDTQGNNSQHWLVFGNGSTVPATAKTNANGQGFTNRFDIFAKLKALKSSWDWEGCFEGPKYPLNVQDTAVSTGDAETLFVPFLAPDEPYVYKINTGRWGRETTEDLKRYSNHYLDGSDCEDCSVNEQWNLLTKASKYKNPSKDGSGSGPNSSCPTDASQTLLQLTSTQSTITTKITQLQEGGYTNLHEGFMWGWRTISPIGPFAAGASYASTTNRKVMVFMTDGFNNWKSQTKNATGSTYQALGYYSYNGTKNDRFPDGTNGDHVNYQNALKVANDTGTDYHDKSRDMQDELTLEACTNAKAAGIEIFTIGFSTPGDQIDEQGLALMKACATNADHYFKAEDSNQLDAAFSAIGIGLGKLRLSL